MPETPDSPIICSWHIPSIDGDIPSHVAGRAAEVTTIVGANGAGKSALGAWMYANGSGAVTSRLIAHRQLWFSSAGPSITPAQRIETGEHISLWNRSLDSRYLDHASQHRANIVLFDLLDRINAQNDAMIDRFVGQGASRESVAQEFGPRMLDRLNAILEEAGLSVYIKLAEKQTFNAVKILEAVEYPIFKMSDGEKAAVLLAAEMLVAPANSVQIVDEPERHLHRSISSRLVEAVIHQRPDCHFVVLTHDLELAYSLSRQPGETLVLAGCKWSGDAVVSWQLRALEADSALPDSVRRAVLGGRTRLAFIEGDQGSIDLTLYRILYPDWQFIPAGGADEVIRAVTGLRASSGNHWIEGRGIVDGDERTVDEKTLLTSREIFPLPVSEAENILYLDVVLAAVARKQAGHFDADQSEYLSDAKRRALEAVRPHIERLSKKLAVSAVRRRAMEQLPTSLTGEEETVKVSIESPYAAIVLDLQAQYDNDNLDALVRRLPIRDTPLRDQVAVALGYRKAQDYEVAARVIIRNDTTLSDQLRGLIGFPS